MAVYHGLGGLAIAIPSVGTAVTALRRTKSRGVRVTSLLGLFFVAAAALGGHLFVFSGLLNNGNSAQMGGAFI